MSYSWKSYRTYQDFEHEELLRMDGLYAEIDEIVDDLFLQGLDARHPHTDPTRLEQPEELDFER